jgi:type IV secretory pathway VirB10-like protein
MELEGNGMSVSGPKECVNNNIVKSTALLQTLLQPSMEILEASIASTTSVEGPASSMAPEPAPTPTPTPMPQEPMTPPTPEPQPTDLPAPVPAPEAEDVLGLEPQTAEEEQDAVVPAPAEGTREVFMDDEVVLEEVEKIETDVLEETDRKVGKDMEVVEKNSAVKKGSGKEDVADLVKSTVDTGSKVLDDNINEEEEQEGKESSAATLIGSTLVALGTLVIALF